MNYDPDSLPEYAAFSNPAEEIVLEIPIVTTTPLLGGGAQARKLDEADGIRVPEIRGQLRFWWRALFAGSSESGADLFQRERRLWGGMGSSPEDIACSKVSLSLKVTTLSQADSSDISLQQPDAYALWTARGTRDAPPAPRRRPGTKLTLTVRCPREQETTVRATLRAWLLFGGVGGRTRRGCGSLGLATAEARTAWLPPAMNGAGLREWLGGHPGIFGYSPSLHGARFHVAQPETDAARAWHTAIAWLREFRQGVNSGAVDTAAAGAFARQRPSLAPGNAGRPGRTRWPEPDKIRHWVGPHSFDHAPLPGHGPDPVWPRAQFGLPIEVRFQTKDRRQQFFQPRPPREAKLGWTDQQPGGRERTVRARDRLASPLIIKPVQLRDGTFLPLALWLSRNLPASAAVGIHRDKDNLDVRSLAPISLMLPASDVQLFAPLAGKATIRDAFMDWVRAKKGVAGGTL